MSAIISINYKIQKTFEGVRNVGFMIGFILLSCKRDSSFFQTHFPLEIQYSFRLIYHWKRLWVAKFGFL
jgi:hypothetical protein